MVVLMSLAIGMRCGVFSFIVSFISYMLLPYGKNSNNRTSGYDVGVAFASRVRLFCLFFVLSPG